jgi:hypothetical protein
MASTPSFNWSTPDNTGLVKNGALDIRTLGNAIDTSMTDLLGGTTGQVLKKNSNTDMDFVWSSDSAGMTNPMTTTGDTIYSSSGSTPARLGIGSTGQVLTVAGGVPSWATPSAGSGGGMTLLSTTTLSGTSTTISSISGSYTNLAIYIFGMTFSTTGAYPVLKPNNASQVANIRHIGYGTTNIATQANTGIAFNLEYNDYKQTGGNNSHFISIENYASTSAYKPISGYGSWETPSSTERHINSGTLVTNSAITSLVIETGTAATFSAGTVLVYGVK